MNKDIKKKWLAALESGEYDKGAGWLRSPDDKYCCLGVLCDLYSKEIGVEWDFAGDAYCLENLASILPYSVVEWSRLESPDPEVNGVLLSTVNDSTSTFDDVIGLIRGYL